MASSNEYTGWGSGPWSRGSWGLDLIEVLVDGVSGAGAVNGAAFPVSVSVTGVSAAGAVGSLEAKSNISVSVTGVSAAAQLGVVLVWSQLVPDQNPGYSPIGPAQSPSWSPIAA